LDQDDVVFFEQKVPNPFLLREPIPRPCVPQEEAERQRLRERKTLDASDHASFLEALANGNPLLVEINPM
jgi:hypothetical protein